ncbi:PhzF family phenazine biosynthesis protein [Neptuniibacter sp. QD37_11]|uniref:PhzF family phenazine biosynthesis protein n=1 Tax=Neptuniibacter sp. QD37_11 TaxID=3398209 RepID=UPI0039F55E2F
MQTVSFRQVDVFTSKPFRGNPVAVVMGGDNFTTEQMQEIASWINLPETTFVVKPHNKDADYGVRIFTTSSELPFAGHPTIGTAHALLESGAIEAKRGAVLQESPAGIFEVFVDDDLIGFEMPPAHIVGVSKTHAVWLDRQFGSGILSNKPPLFIDVGIKWLVLEMKNASTVMSVIPNTEDILKFSKESGIAGIVIFGTESESNEEWTEVRAFLPSLGTNEDAACGSGNGAVGYFMQHYADKPTEVERFIRQGRHVGRDAYISLGFSLDGKVSVRGSAVTCLEGHILAPA